MARHILNPAYNTPRFNTVADEESGLDWTKVEFLSIDGPFVEIRNDPNARIKIE